MRRGKLRQRRGADRQVRGSATLTAALVGALLLGGSPAFADDPGSAPDGSTSTDVAPPRQGLPAPNTGLAPNGTGTGSAAFVPGFIDPAVVPEPPVNEDLPLEVDKKAPFAQQISCDPVDRPGVTAFALLVSEHYDRPTYFGARPCIDYASFHHDGRALDWPLAAWDAQDRMVADAVLTWLTDNDAEMAKRLGIEYMIWNGLIYYVDGRGWQYYTGNPHTDHIHFSFSWDGATMRTSWWTGVAVTEPDLGPCDVTPWAYAAIHEFPRITSCSADLVSSPDTGLSRVRPGEAGGGVAMLQGVLGLEQTGVLDDKTREALLAWQDEQRIPETGVADAFTYAVAQGWEVGELPESALSVGPEEWQKTEFTPLRRTTLTQGDEGEAVEVLQAAIGAEVDGSFGPKTAAALLAWEKTIPELATQAERRGEDEPAKVTPLTWVFLERAVYPTIAVRDVELEIGDLDQVADPEGVLVAKSVAESVDVNVPTTDLDSPYAGGAVAMLQTLLGVDADGSFGPLTEAAVKAVQEAAELEPTGVVDGPTWLAVEKVALDEGRVAGAPGYEAAKKAAKEKAAKEKAEKEKRAKEEAERKAKAQREAYQAAMSRAG